MDQLGLATAMAQDLGMPLSHAKRVVQSFVKIFTETMDKGESLKICKMGTFSTRTSTNIKFRNPKTGEYGVIPSRTYLKFTAAGKFARHRDNGRTKNPKVPDATT